MATTTNQLHQELKHKFILERLVKLGIRESQSGKSINDLSYEELKYELVLASFKEIETQCDAGKWF